MAEALRCSHCGASLPGVTPDVASVPCRSCGQVTRVDGALLEVLHGHERRVGDVNQQTESAREAAVMSELTGSFGAGWAWVFVGSWLIAGLFALPETPLAYALGLGIFAAPLVAMMLVARRRLVRLRAAAADAGAKPVPVHCPGCGGQVELAPEAPVRACRYCDGALAADAPALAELVASAKVRLHAQQRLATEQRWRLAAAQGRAPRTDLVPYFVIGGIGGLWVVGSLAATVRVLVLGAAAPPLLELAIMNAIAAVIVIGVAAPLLARRRRLQRWRARVDALVAELSVDGRASASTQLSSFAQWLIDHWLGELANRYITGALGYVFVAVESPAPWAISIAPVEHADARVERHLRIFVPGEPGSLLAEVGARLEPLGFRATLHEGGLVAELDLGDASKGLAGLDGADAALDALRGARFRGPQPRGW